ncbi:MotB [Planctomycetales bacterium]|nr:MotB [Planctomycetales bacterium]
MNNDEDNNNWTLTYSDMMSLLLCFFIMLYAVSTVQDSKMDAATASIRSSFGLFGEMMSETETVSKTSKKSNPFGADAGVRIFFDAGKDDLTDEAKLTLDDFLRQLLAGRQRVIITGSTAADEPAGYRRTLDLAYSRGTAVWDYCVSQGIQRERITVELDAEAESACASVRVLR